MSTPHGKPVKQDIHQTFEVTWRIRDGHTAIKLVRAKSIDRALTAAMDWYKRGTMTPGGWVVVCIRQLQIGLDILQA